MYISEPPCGDGSLTSDHWTGAKSVHTHESTLAFGITRLKCGRSDLLESQRSESMSCSDKLLKWNCLGLQGSLLGQLIEEPLWLTSLIVEGGELEAVERGVKVRKRRGGESCKGIKKINEPIVVRVGKRVERVG